MLPTTIRHKILLTTFLCALVILAGFSTVFLIGRQQQELVQNHLELPLVAQNWFSLSNKLHQTLRLQLETATDQEGNTTAWEKVWIKEIDPLLNILEDLYKKERLWENERQVEARTFYDIRLMPSEVFLLCQQGVFWEWVKIGCFFSVCLVWLPCFIFPTPC